MEFKVGDVVRLIGGGPKMTVSYVEPNIIGATWFEREQSASTINGIEECWRGPYREQFSPSSLEKVDQ